MVTYILNKKKTVIKASLTVLHKKETAVDTWAVSGYKIILYDEIDGLRNVKISFIFEP